MRPGRWRNQAAGKNGLSRGRAKDNRDMQQRIFRDSARTRFMRTREKLLPRVCVKPLMEILSSTAP